MLPQKILSLQHPFVKHWKKLREDKKYRQEQKSIIIFGSKMVVEFAIHHPIKRLLLSQNYSLSIPATELYTLSEELFKKISGMKNPEPVAAEIDMPAPINLINKKYILALDRIRDPGNLGTLIRSAWALGVEGVLFLPGCVDLFNDKALRSAKGASLHMPFQYIQESDLLAYKRANFTIYIADIEGSDFQKITYVTPYILLLGNEGEGLSKNLAVIGKKVTIPMQNSTNSLNVGVAGSIILYNMLKKI